MHPIRRGTRPNVVTAAASGRADVEFLESRTLLSVGSISGTVFNDANLSYSRNAGEAGIAGIRVFVDTNKNGRLDAGEPSALTNAAGAYNIGNLQPGSYQLREITPAGYRPTSPWQGFWTVGLGSGQNLLNFDFGNTRTGVISGSVFRDANGNGVQNTGEAGLAGWRVYVDANNNGRFDAGEVSTITNATGGYSLTLNPGTYHVREVVNSGYTQTAPAGGVWTIVLASGQVVGGKLFGNKPNTTVPPPPPPPPPRVNPAKVFGTVFRDANGNGVQDAGDVALPGWRVYADLNNNGSFDAGEPTFLTNAQGIYELDLNPGTYHVREVVNSGFAQTSPAGGAWTLGLISGEILTGKSFGNKPTTPVPPPPPPPPPTGGAFVITTTRAVWSGNAADDIVTFYARNTGTGVLAGTRDILGEDATLSSAGGLVIRANSAGAADFSGTQITPTASYVGLGTSMFVASATPGTYHDMQTVRQFEVAGLMLHGVLADSGAGAKIAVAIVPHGSAVNLSGSLGAEAGPTVAISASA